MIVELSFLNANARNLAQVVLPELSSRHRAATAACVVDVSDSEDLVGTTKVGQMIAALSKDTELAVVETLSTFNEDDASKLTELEETLSAQNPKEKAAELRRAANRLKTLETSIDAVADIASQAAVDALKTHVSEANTAIAAEELARATFQSGEALLPSTGCREWQQLFEAARKYGELAYQDKKFPPTGEGKCPLCQQDLKDGAERLVRFDTFIKNAAATEAKKKRLTLTQAIETLQSSKLTIAVDEALAEELDQLAPELRPAIDEFRKAVAKRRDWMVTASASNIWDGEIILEVDARPRLCLSGSNIPWASSSTSIAIPTFLKAIGGRIEIDSTGLRCHLRIVHRNSKPVCV